MCAGVFVCCGCYVSVWMCVSLCMGDCVYLCVCVFVFVCGCGCLCVGV